jgi:hypothetical protein
MRSVEIARFPQGDATLEGGLKTSLQRRRAFGQPKVTRSFLIDGT